MKQNIENERIKKLKALAKIRRSAYVASRSYNSPKFNGMIIGAFVGGLTGWIIANILQNEFLVIVGIFIGCIVGFRAAKYPTWTEDVFSQLIAYEPEDKTAYALLQQYTAEGTVDFVKVILWADQEKEALSPTTLTKADAVKSAFVNKQLD